MKKRLWTAFGLLVLGLHARAQDRVADNVEMKQIYDADQKDREGFPAKTTDWDKLSPRDRARRRRVRELIDGGQLKTGQDYWRAGMVFQHGEGVDDILFAHVLAVTAMAKGGVDARWWAATTLDGLLQRLGQDQVFGTQFLWKTQNGRETWTMEPYNRTLVPADLRKVNCVPDLRAQEQMLDAVRHGREPEPGKLAPRRQSAEFLKK
jgi:hypothetical protein